MMAAYYFVPEGIVQRLALLGLVCVWAALLFGGMALQQFFPQMTVFQKSSRQPARTVADVTRILSSCVLVLTAWVWVFVVHTTSIGAYAILVSIGMTLGALGDLVLAGWVRLPQALLCGMGLFGLGHVCYIGAVFGFANLFGLNDVVPRWLALGLWLVIGVTGWFIIVQRGHPSSLLRSAALGYALLLSTLAGATTGIALQDTRFIPLALGGGLFLLSDLLLAGEQFGNFPSPALSNVIWLTYGPAQALIVSSVGSALALRH
jgi:hypothetical protein